MTDWQLTADGLYVPPTAIDGAYLAIKDGTRFDKFGQLVDGSGTTVNVDPVTGDVSIDSTGGGGGAPTFHGCAATTTTAQTMSTTGTAVQFNLADEWDTDSIHNPSTNNTRFTIPVGLGGKWQFVGMLAWASSSNSRSIQWSKNGTSLSTLYRSVNAAVASATMRQTAVVVLDLAAGDYVECLGIPSANQQISEARLTCHYLGA